MSVARARQLQDPSPMRDTFNVGGNDENDASNLQFDASAQRAEILPPEKIRNDMSPQQSLLARAKASAPLGRRTTRPPSPSEVAAAIAAVQSRAAPKQTPVSFRMQPQTSTLQTTMGQTNTSTANEVGPKVTPPTENSSLTRPASLGRPNVTTTLPAAPRTPTRNTEPSSKRPASLDRPNASVVTLPVSPRTPTRNTEPIIYRSNMWNFRSSPKPLSPPANAPASPPRSGQPVAAAKGNGGGNSDRARAPVSPKSVPSKLTLSPSSPPQEFLRNAFASRVVAAPSVPSLASTASPERGVGFLSFGSRGRNRRDAAALAATAGRRSRAKIPIQRRGRHVPPKGEDKEVILEPKQPQDGPEEGKSVSDANDKLCPSENTTADQKSSEKLVDLGSNFDASHAIDPAQKQNEKPQSNGGASVGQTWTARETQAISDTSPDSLKDQGISAPSDESRSDSSATVDPLVLAGLGAFIDSLHSKRPSLNESNENDRSKSSASHTHHDVENSSRDTKQDAEAPIFIGAATHSVQKQDSNGSGAGGVARFPTQELSKAENPIHQNMDDSDSSDSSSEEESVSPETRAGISAFIDSLHRKNETEVQNKVDAKPDGDHFGVDEFMYMSSSDESKTSDQDDFVSPETEEELTAFISSVQKISVSSGDGVIETQKANGTMTSPLQVSNGEKNGGDKNLFAASESQSFFTRPPSHTAGDEPKQTSDSNDGNCLKASSTRPVSDANKVPNSNIKSCGTELSTNASTTTGNVNSTNAAVAASKVTQPQADGFDVDESVRQVLSTSASEESTSLRKQSPAIVRSKNEVVSSSGGLLKLDSTGRLRIDFTRQETEKEKCVPLVHTVEAGASPQNDELNEEPHDGEGKEGYGSVSASPSSATSESKNSPENVEIGDPLPEKSGRKASDENIFDIPNIGEREIGHPGMQQGFDNKVESTVEGTQNQDTVLVTDGRDLAEDEDEIEKLRNVLSTDEMDSATEQGDDTEDEDPEGTTAEELAQLNIFIRKAGEIVQSSNPSKEEMENILNDAKMKGFPVEIIEDIFKDIRYVESSELLKNADQTKANAVANSDEKAAAKSEKSKVSGSEDRTMKEPDVPEDLSEGDGTHNWERFSEMEKVDDNEAIASFLTRFSNLSAGGHFPDANMDGLGIFKDVGKSDDDEVAVEVDLMHGFVKKELSVSCSEEIQVADENVDAENAARASSVAEGYVEGDAGANASKSPENLSQGIPDGVGRIDYYTKKACELTNRGDVSDDDIKLLIRDAKRDGVSADAISKLFGNSNDGEVVAEVDAAHELTSENPSVARQEDFQGEDTAVEARNGDRTFRSGKGGDKCDSDEAFDHIDRTNDTDKNSEEFQVDYGTTKMDCGKTNSEDATIDRLAQYRKKVSELVNKGGDASDDEVGRVFLDAKRDGISVDAISQLFEEFSERMSQNPVAGKENGDSLGTGLDCDVVVVPSNDEENIHLIEAEVDRVSKKDALSLTLPAEHAKSTGASDSCSTDDEVCPADAEVSQNLPVEEKNRNSSAATGIEYHVAVVPPRDEENVYIHRSETEVDRVGESDNLSMPLPVEHAKSASTRDIVDEVCSGDVNPCQEQSSSKFGLPQVPIVRSSSISEYSNASSDGIGDKYAPVDNDEYIPAASSLSELGSDQMPEKVSIATKKVSFADDSEVPGDEESRDGDQTAFDVQGIRNHENASLRREERAPQSHDSESSPSSDESHTHDWERFSEMEKVDDSEAIVAFLARFSNLPAADQPDGDQPDGDQPDGDQPDGDQPDSDAHGMRNHNDASLRRTERTSQSHDSESESNCSGDERQTNDWERFSEMEKVDDSEAIAAFLTRFSNLSAGGHFPDANVEGLGIFKDLGKSDDDDVAVEVDLVHGFVKKDLSVSCSEEIEVVDNTVEADSAARTSSTREDDSGKEVGEVSDEHASKSPEDSEIDEDGINTDDAQIDDEETSPEGATAAEIDRLNHYTKKAYEMARSGDVNDDERAMILCDAKRDGVSADAISQIFDEFSEPKSVIPPSGEGALDSLDSKDNEVHFKDNVMEPTEGNDDSYCPGGSLLSTAEGSVEGDTVKEAAEIDNRDAHKSQEGSQIIDEGVSTPEGATTEEIERLNYYTKKAHEVAKRRDASDDEVGRILRDAKRDGVPVDAISYLFDELSRIGPGKPEAMENVDDRLNSRTDEMHRAVGNVETTGTFDGTRGSDSSSFADKAHMSEAVDALVLKIYEDARNAMGDETQEIGEAVRCSGSSFETATQNGKDKETRIPDIEPGGSMPNSSEEVEASDNVVSPALSVCKKAHHAVKGIAGDTFVIDETKFQDEKKGTRVVVSSDCSEALEDDDAFDADLIEQTQKEDYEMHCSDDLQTTESIDAMQDQIAKFALAQIVDAVSDEDPSKRVPSEPASDENSVQEHELANSKSAKGLKDDATDEVDDELAAVFTPARNKNEPLENEVANNHSVSPIDLDHGQHERLHFYAKKVMELARSQQPSMEALGDILCEAKKENIPVELVTHIYKEARLKASRGCASSPNGMTEITDLSSQVSALSMGEAEERTTTAFVPLSSSQESEGLYSKGISAQKMDGFTTGKELPSREKRKKTRQELETNRRGEPASSDDENVASMEQGVKITGTTCVPRESKKGSDEVQSEQSTTFSRSKSDASHIPSLDRIPSSCSAGNATNESYDSCNIEVDLLNGFVRKDLFKAPERADDENYSSPTKRKVSEVRNVDGDAEVYFLGDANVEVSFVDEEEKQEVMQSCDKCGVRSAKEQPEGGNGPVSFVMNGSKTFTPDGSLSVDGSSLEEGDAAQQARISRSDEKMTSLDRMFEERDEKIIRDADPLGNWKSPWERRWIHEIDDCYDEATTELSLPSGPAPIDGVAAAALFAKRAQSKGRRRRPLVKQQWSAPYEERTKAHPGYFDVDFYSLYEATMVVGDPHELDNVPWEHRDVRQRFLQEKSIGIRNWFGKVKKDRGNERVYLPICHPRSVKMHMKNIPEPGEWSEDWYTTWQSRKDNPNNLVTFAKDDIVIKGKVEPQPVLEEDSESSKGDEEGDNGSEGSSTVSLDRYAAVHSEGLEESDDDIEVGEDGHVTLPVVKPREIPEIGTLCTVRLKIGERVSRVHYQYTSSLRKSRWKRKYFPQVGAFPYD